MEDLLYAVGNYGFPMAVSAWLLLRLEGRMESLTASIQELIQVLSARTTR